MPAECYKKTTTCWTLRLRGSLMMAAVLAATYPLLAESTLNAQGEQGKTSYRTLPFVSTLWGASWASTSGLSPSQLYWNYGSHFTSTVMMNQAQGASSDMSGQGIVPCIGSQRWEDTFMAAQAYQAGEPAWVTQDRANGGGTPLNQLPEYQAWVAWMNARPNLNILDNQGNEATYTVNGWVNHFGYVSPLMPLSAADAASIGKSSATYGDWYAYQYGQVAALTGAYGVLTSDFSDSQPIGNTSQVGFNPEIILAFARSRGAYNIPHSWGDTVALQAAYINAHFFNEWTDFTCAGYAKFWGEMASQITQNTGNEGLIVIQSGLTAASRRVYGSDNRIITQYMSSKNVVVGWDAISMAPERGGESQVGAISGAVLAAAREPNIRNGANLPANNDTYWQAVQKFRGQNLDWENATYANTPADLQVRGLGELKRAWLELSWSHIADRDGNTRRALSFMSRHYWDGGNLDAKTTELIQTITPARPFGFALYYSVNTERALAAQGDYYSYYDYNDLIRIKDGLCVNYYVSDAAFATPGALANMQNSASKPTAWLVLDHPELLTAQERAALESIAPILTSVEQAKNFADAPLKFSDGGDGSRITGDGFYDQNDRLIIVASNLSADTLSASMTLRGLALGQYTAEDLYTSQILTFDVTGASATVNFGLTAWDTRVFAITGDFSVASVPEPCSAALISGAGVLLMMFPGKSGTGRSRKS